MKYVIHDMHSHRAATMAAILIVTFVAPSRADKPAPKNAPAPAKARLAAATESPAASAVRAAAPLITIELAKAEIADALRMIASQGELNLVIGPEVAGAISVSLTRVPVDQALQAVAMGHGLQVIKNGDIVTVTKPQAGATNGANAAPPAAEIAPEMVTRVFRPRSISATDLRWALDPALSTYRDKAGKRLSSIAVLSQDSRPGYGIATLAAAAGGSGSGASSTSGSASSTYSPTTTSTAGTNGTNGATLASATTVDTASSAVQQSQVLVITDTPAKLEEISRLIDDLDRPPKQVLVEARVVEMKLSLQKLLGIDWNIEVSANGPLTQWDFPLNHNSLEFATATTGGDFRPSLGTVDFTRFSAVLRANQDNGGVRLLANPRLLIHNNHRSGILVGERYPILRTTITDQGTATESFEQYIPVGIQLDVTPTVLADNRVSMLVHPATTSLGDDVVGTTGLKVARILTREIDTRVVVGDGQTIVLGGLIADRRDSLQRKVPGLGDVPIANWFFRQERRNDERVDLLVFVTVRVDGSEKIDARDREVFDTYRPHFKRITSLKEADLQFELPGFDQNGEKGNGDEFLGDEEKPPTPAAQKPPAQTSGGFTVRPASGNGK